MLEFNKTYYNIKEVEALAELCIKIYGVSAFELLDDGGFKLLDPTKIKYNKI